MLYVQVLFIGLYISLYACIAQGSENNYSERIKKMNDEKEVSYQNEGAGITISGTLTLPRTQGPFPVVLLISGMGPTDRDGTAYGFKPLLVLADHLTRKGIAVLRVDKRGVGKSTGKFDTTVTCRDLADDVLAGIAYLKTCKEVNPNHIGLIGHSEGGLVATLVAAQSKDVAAVILMAGAVNNSIQSTVEQAAIQLQADGASPEMIERDSAIRKQILEIIKFQTNPDEAEKQLRTVLAHYFAALSEDQKKEVENFSFAFSQSKTDAFINFMNSAYYRFFLTYDSSVALAHIHVPLLAIYGELDFMAPHLMLPFIRASMEQAKNKDYTALELPKLNHSLQTCQTGAMAEYATIKETIAPIALNAMSDWILARTVKKN